MKNFLIHFFQTLLSWLSRQPLVQRLQQRYPGAFRFALRRFDTTVFVGLPLTMLLLAIGINAMLLSELTEDVIESDGIVHIDGQFTNFLYSIRSNWLSQVFYAFTQLGTREAVFAIGGLASIVMLYKRRYPALLAFWITMAGVGLSVQYGKKIISRDRPPEVAYYPVGKFSFPSGHATTTIALYGMLASLVYRHLDRRWQRRAVLAAAGALVLIVGFSRIYLGVHYLSDVLAGFLLGAMWVLLGISLMEVMVHLRKRGAGKV